ncbi:MAG: LEPR-XLL domain-containing protein, partial [Maioricimonas sp. JB049]
MNTASTTRRKLHVEALEERVLLAGNITFIGIHNLAALGLGTTAAFVGQGTDVEFNVAQNAAGDYILEGLNGTTFTIDGVTTNVYTT